MKLAISISLLFSGNWTRLERFHLSSDRLLWFRTQEAFWITGELQVNLVTTEQHLITMTWMSESLHSHRPVKTIRLRVICCGFQAWNLNVLTQYFSVFLQCYDVFLQVKPGRSVPSGTG